MLKGSLLDMNKQERIPSTINKIAGIVSEIKELNPNVADFDHWDIVLIAVDSLKRDLKGEDLQ